MPTIYIIFCHRFTYYKICCKNNRDLDSWFDVLESKKEQLQRDLSVGEKQQIMSSFLKIKNLCTVPFLYAAGPPVFNVTRKDTMIHLNLSTHTPLFSYNRDFSAFFNHALTINFIDNDKNNN